MPKFGLRALLMIFAGIGILLAMICPAVVQIQEAGHRTVCRNNLRQIALGMLCYESVHGRLPIGIETTAAGTPCHSWRVQVAPFLESAQQFYDRKHAWDSKVNARLYNETAVIATDKGGGNPRSIVLDPCPDWFWCWCCPSDSKKRVNYAVVVGDETAFPLNRSVTFKEISDGLENTILVVETLCGSSVWIEPRDIQFDTMKFVIGEAKNGGLASKHGLSVNVCFADGLVYSVTSSISPEEPRALLTISGNESITRQELLDRGVLR